MCVCANDFSAIVVTTCGFDSEMCTEETGEDVMNEYQRL